MRRLLVSLTFSMVFFLGNISWGSNPISPNTEFPLHLAVFENDLKRVKSLLRGGSDPNIKMMNGITPLHLALRGGHLKAAEILIKSGAQINSVDSNGVTPIDEAYIFKNQKSIEFLQLFTKHEGIDIESQFNRREIISNAKFPTSSNLSKSFSHGLIFSIMNALRKATPKEIFLRKIALDLNPTAKDQSFKITAWTDNSDRVFQYVAKLRRSKYFKNASIESTEEVQIDQNSYFMNFTIAVNIDDLESQKGLKENDK